MKQLFIAQASLYNVLPLDDRQAERQLACHRPSIAAGRKTFTYYPGFQAPEGATPDLKNANHRMTATIENLQESDEGMLITEGGRFAGFGLFVRNDREFLHGDQESSENGKIISHHPELVYYYNYLGLDQAHSDPTNLGSELVNAQYEVVVDLSDYVGDNLTAKVDFVYGGDWEVDNGDETTIYVPGGKAIVTLTVHDDDDPSKEDKEAILDLPFTLPYRMTQDENLVVGFDDGSPIVKPNPNDITVGIDGITSPVYEMPFEFTGTLDKVVVDLDEDVSSGPCNASES